MGPIYTKYCDKGYFHWDIEPKRSKKPSQGCPVIKCKPVVCCPWTFLRLKGPWRESELQHDNNMTHPTLSFLPNFRGGESFHEHPSRSNPVFLSFIVQLFMSASSLQSFKGGSNFWRRTLSWCLIYTSFIYSLMIQPLHYSSAIKLLDVIFRICYRTCRSIL